MVQHILKPQKIITIVFLCLHTLLFSQNETYSVSGQVFAESTNEALSDANVTILLFRQGTTTDQNGFFKFTNLSPGQYQLQVAYLSKQTQTLNIRIENQDINLQISLEDDPTALKEVTITDDKTNNYGIQHLRQVEASAIYASKKSELILVNALTVNKASNNSRQIYAKVSGLNIWESDCAGVQLGIGGRGLSPSRNSNFNTRQNGYDISADALGYPESYYTPPIEAIERIEIVRGASSLQFGTQFGGMLNFVFKEGPKDKKLEVHTRQSVGSCGLLSSFNSLGGTMGKVNYYGFYQYKHSDGWRPNSDIYQHTAYFSAKIKLNNKLTIQPDFTHTNYLAQQPGGLTDTEFNDNPRQSKRTRNWFKVNWNLFALTLDYKITQQLKINIRNFGLLAGRDALGNIDNINLLDFGENRDYLNDEYKNWGNETRLLYQYNIFKNPATFLIGFRYYNGLTFRRQGEANNGSGADFLYLHPDNLEGSDFELPSKNSSVFAEHVFNPTSKWSITPGLRFEHINTGSKGYFREITKDLAGNIINDRRIDETHNNKRSFLFWGIGSSFRPAENLEIYTNFTQNYKSINFNDIRVNVGNMIVDENLEDERGFNFDIGARGRIKKFFDFDITFYHLAYKGRIGNVLKTEPNPVFNGLVNRIIRFRTNVADADIFGFESVAELHLLKWLRPNAMDFDLSIFTNLSLTRAAYKNAGENGIDGNDVELAPPLNFKSGINFRWKKLKSGIQYSFTKAHFSDATNAVFTPSAIEGIIPDYQVMDFSLSYKFKFLEIETGINNLLNEQYFTRRATGYPGPGIIPSDGRNYYLTLGARF